RRRRSQEAWAAGFIDPDLVPIGVAAPDRGWGLATADEPPRPGTTVEGMQGLPTPFRAGGRVTAATSSPLTDGATAALLVAADKAAEWGLSPRMRLVSYSYAGVPPETMGLGPVDRKSVG